MSWVPINENHAISAMVVFIEFANPLPDRLVRTCLKILEASAFALELTSSRGTSSMQMQLKDDGTFEQSEAAVGRVFARRTDPSGPEPTVGRQVESIQLDTQNLMYRTWDYISWQWHADRIRKLFEPCLSLIESAVSFNVIGMEYLDKFRSTDEIPGANLSSLLRRDSDLLPSYIFDLKHLFHAHTGAFVVEDDLHRDLQSCRIDTTDEDGQRWVNIATRQEWRAVSAEAENPDPFDIYEKIHADLKNFLARVITEDQANKIYLKA